MYNDFIKNNSEKTRREVLINVRELLNDVNKLKELAGKNALLDCALYLVAKDDSKLMHRLNYVISTDELIADIKHINKSSDLKEIKKEKFGG